MNNIHILIGTSNMYWDLNNQNIMQKLIMINLDMTNQTTKKNYKKNLWYEFGQLNTNIKILYNYWENKYSSKQNSLNDQIADTFVLMYVNKRYLLKSKTFSQKKKIDIE